MGLKSWIVENIVGKRSEPRQIPLKVQTSKKEDKEKKEMEEKEMEDKELKGGIDKKKINENYEEEKRIKEWSINKDQILQKYQIPIADDAKYVAEELFGKSQDSVSVFFITDERAIRQRYLEGGEAAIEEYANNLEKAFVGGPITFTLLRRLNALKDAKNDGNVIDTEIDIDGFTPNGRIQYAINEIDLDGQKIPSRRKFSPRCEMTATITEGFHVGPFVAYDELYFCTKEEMEQMVEKEKIGTGEAGMGSNSMVGSLYSTIGMGMKEDKEIKEELCPHGSAEDLYCNQCDGDIIISPSKKKVIGILLDVTGSMSGIKIERAKMAVKKVLEKIPVDSSIEIVLTVFSTRFKEFYEDIIPYGVDFTQQVKEMAIEKVRRLYAEGDTPLYETVNRFLDDTWTKGALDKDKIFFPYTYLIIVSDGEDNHSKLENLIYKGKREKYAFFVKLKEYRDSGLITEIIPFAYGEGPEKDMRLIKELKEMITAKDKETKFGGRILINETDPERIIGALTSTVDSILYGSDNLKMMGIPVSRLAVKKPISSTMESM